MPQSVTENFEDLERELGILQADLPEIIRRQSQKDGSARCLSAGGISAAVKNSYFRERISTPLNSNELLSPVRSRLRDLYCAFLYDQQFMAPIPFGKDHGTLLKAQAAHVFGD